VNINQYINAPVVGTLSPVIDVISDDGIIIADPAGRPLAKQGGSACYPFACMNGRCHRLLSQHLVAVNINRPQAFHPALQLPLPAQLPPPQLLQQPLPQLPLLLAVQQVQLQALIVPINSHPPCHHSHHSRFVVVSLTFPAHVANFIILMMAGIICAVFIMKEE